GIYQLLTGITDVFFAHAYASYKRGTKENQHKLVRRFIPMGKRLKNVSTKKINRIEQWMNNIPRKILGYQTAKEAFLKELQLFVSNKKHFYKYSRIIQIPVANLNLKFLIMKKLVLL